LSWPDRAARALVSSSQQFSRAAGVALPLFALRGPRDLGTGEILDLVAFVDWMDRWDQRIIQLLPINETAIGEASPYNTLSAFAIDPAYISVWQVPDVERSRAAQEFLLTPRVRAQVRRWRQSPQRQRRGVYVLKLQLLDLGFAAFRNLPASNDRRTAFADFRRRNAWWLEHYALFRALKERRRWVSWEAWPESLRNGDAATLRRTTAGLQHRIQFFQYLQWIAAEQWGTVREHARHRGVLLKGDLSFVCGRDSADVWAHQELFDLHSSAGAPPDAFCLTGQAWGLPLYDWGAMRASNYEWWRQRARQGGVLFDLFRIDHVVGLFRTYAIPVRAGGAAGFVPHDEAEQATQGHDLLSAVIEAAGGSGVIAEDLGTVPDWVRDSLTRLHIPGYKVFRWERNGEAFIDPRTYAPLSVATTGTHDTDTLATWLEGLTGSERAALAEVLHPTNPGVRTAESRSSRPSECYSALLRRLYEAASVFTILPIQDLFGWRERINTPATTDRHNWRYRLPVETSRLDTLPEVRERMEAIRALIKESGRCMR
jgi:4-alpha-glucanotransferase